MSRRSPLMRSVILGNAGTIASLYALLVPRDTSFLLPVRAQMVQVQLDPGAGGAKLFVGDPDFLASTDCGVSLVATQALTINSLDSNLIMLKDIGLRSDTSSVQVNITVVTR